MMRYVLYLFLIPIFSSSEAKAQKIYELGQVDVSSKHIVDTVFGTWKYSVADYEFLDDKLILLTFKRNMSEAAVMLVDQSQKVLSSFELPDEAKELYKDYQGDIHVICENHIYRIILKNEQINLGSLPVDDYKKFIMPCIDTLGKDIYFSNFQKDYPAFTYYAYNRTNKSLATLKRVCDEALMDGYNMEFYFMQPKEQLFARKIAMQYGLDFHRVAANMTGLTTSLFYTPLYAPLFIIHDTVCIFDHYSNAILKYDKKQNLLDSIPIDYNHPKKWKDWKRELLLDKVTNEVYAVYERGGFYYLKNIDLQTGKIKGSFKLTNQYVDKIKIKNNYVYYVFKPYDSQQEKFIYKELISN
jgi:hypothetical protein